MAVKKKTVKANVKTDPASILPIPFSAYEDRAIITDKFDYEVLLKAFQGQYGSTESAYAIHIPQAVSKDKYQAMNEIERLDYLKQKMIPFSINSLIGTVNFRIQLAKTPDGSLPIDPNYKINRSFLVERGAATFSESVQIIWEMAHEGYPAVLSESLHTVPGLTDSVLMADGTRVKCVTLADLLKVIPAYSGTAVLDAMAGQFGTVNAAVIPEKEIEHLTADIVEQFYTEFLEWQPGILSFDTWYSSYKGTELVRMGTSKQDFAIIDTSNIVIAVDDERKLARLVSLNGKKCRAISTSACSKKQKVDFFE